MAGMRILLVEDDQVDQMAIRRFLEKERVPYAYRQATSLTEAKRMLASEEFDAIVADYWLGDGTALDLFDAAPDTPLIVVTGTGTETIAAQAMKSGAADYLIKDSERNYLNVLPATVEQAIDRHRAEERMREQAAMLNTAHDAILATDLDDHVFFWNQGAGRLYGWTEAEACGRRSVELLYGLNEAESRLAWAGVLGNGTWRGELRQVSRQGQILLVDGRWTLVRDRAGRPKSILMVHTDITEKKMLQAQLLRLQRMESLATLASGMAHHLNNALTPIAMAVDLLRSPLPDAQRQAILKTLESCTAHSADIIKHVLAYATGAPGQRTAVAIGTVIRQAEYALRQSLPPQIVLHTFVADDLQPVRGDLSQLTQVVVNLCLNAKDAMPNGGDLSLTAENQVIDTAFARVNLEANPGPYVHLKVADTGQGIPPELLERIFDPFFTTKPIGKGMGLGLSVASGIVRGHGGFMTVSSTVGKGSAFSIHLPVAVPEVPVRRDSESASFPRGHGELILVVDDDTMVRAVTQATLEAFNYRVITAENGSEALKEYEKHAREVQLVLLDLMMPIMDGAATIQALRESHPEVRILIATGVESTPETIADTGVKDYLQKPFRTEDLLQTMRKLLDRK